MLTKIHIQGFRGLSDFVTELDLTADLHQRSLHRDLARLLNRDGASAAGGLILGAHSMEPAPLPSRLCRARGLLEGQAGEVV